MKLFGWKRQSSGVSDAYRHAATTLYIAAKAETAGSTFPDLNGEIIEALNNLLFLTRIAIFIGWLRRVGMATSDAKYPALLRELETLVFPQDAIEGLGMLEVINELDKLLWRAQRLTGPNQAAMPEFAIEMRELSEDWLSLALEPAGIDSLGVTKPIQLTLQLIDEMQFLGTVLSDTAERLGERP